MVGQTMKIFLTLLDTIKTSDGNTILYRVEQLANFFKRTYEENYAKMSDEEKIQCFHVEQEYGDILNKAYKNPLHNLVNQSPESNSGLFLQSETRNPTEEYEHVASMTKEDFLTDEEHQLKLERLRIYKEIFESQND